MAISLATLPPELLDIVLSYLSISSLLAFSATNKGNQTIAHKALRILKLAVLPREIQCRIAFMTQRSQCCLSDEEDVPDALSLHHLSCVGKTTSQITSKRMKVTDPAKAHASQIKKQNQVAADILGKGSLRHLRSLEINLYDITSAELTAMIATQLPHLRHLELNMSHSFIHDQFLPSNYWREAPVGNSCWNALVGLGSVNQEKLRLRNLQSLSIDRAGMTSAQLRSLVQSNPRLQRIWLSNVSGVDLEFVRWLACYTSELKSRLDEIVFENCSNLALQKLEDFDWLADISGSGLERLSLFKCKHVNHDLLIQLLDERTFDLRDVEVIIPPQGPPCYPGRTTDLKTATPSHPTCIKSGLKAGIMSEKIEVDPAYLTREFATAA